MAEVESVKAEYNMGQLDYFRLDQILQKKITVEYDFFNGKRGAIKEFFAILKVFWLEMREVFVPSIREKIDEDFKKCRKAVNGKTLYNPQLLEEINNTLMDCKHKIGIGFRVVPKQTESQRIKSGFAR